MYGNRLPHVRIVPRALGLVLDGVEDFGHIGIFSLVAGYPCCHPVVGTPVDPGEQGDDGERWDRGQPSREDVDRHQDDHGDREPPLEDRRQRDPFDQRRGVATQSLDLPTTSVEGAVDLFHHRDGLDHAAGAGQGR